VLYYMYSTGTSYLSTVNRLVSANFDEGIKVITNLNLGVAYATSKQESSESTQACIAIG